MRFRSTAYGGAAVMLGVCALLAAGQAQAAPTPVPQGPAASMVDPDTPAGVQPLASGGSRAAQTLVFSDEFNGSTVDSSKWTARDQEREGAAPGDTWWYKPSNVRTDNNGALALEVASMGPNTFSGARIDTQGKFKYTHGTLEASVHTPYVTNGHLAAVWLQADGGHTPGGVVDGTARDGSEMDIVETAYQADKYPTAIHWDGYGADHQSIGATHNAPGLHSVWYHTFGLNWTPTKLEFTYDGTVVRTVTDPKLISQVMEFPILSHEVLDNWADGSIHNETYEWTSNMYVDYIRIWQ
ncbi:family 16 glycosylhydrolase [Streptomyces sp. NPDC008061]|jgi:beta-glucanase (GH16 family)|uniref:glycoside hydrolase family 16 protein n=1 Tax=Streptomyces sp. NPDC008061 TaxID=3364805 RepID=UPI0036E3A08C